jgi:hypothetical protein
MVQTPLSSYYLCCRLTRQTYHEISPSSDVGEDFCVGTRDHFQFLLTAVILAGTLHNLPRPRKRQQFRG